MVSVWAVGFLPLEFPSPGPSTLSLLLEISSGFPTKHIFGENILCLNIFFFFFPMETRFLLERHQNTVFWEA